MPMLLLRVGVVMLPNLPTRDPPTPWLYDPYVQQNLHIPVLLGSRDRQNKDAVHSF
jgi:hypothetical protein